MEQTTRLLLCTWEGGKAKISNSGDGRETGNKSGKKIKQSLEFSRAVLLRNPSYQIFDYLILIFEESKLAYMPPNCSHEEKACCPLTDTHAEEGCLIDIRT